MPEQEHDLDRWVDETRAGKQRARHLLSAALWRSIRRGAMTICPSEADDIAQKKFMGVLNAVMTGLDHPVAFAFRAGKNGALDCVRAQPGVVSGPEPIDEHGKSPPEGVSDHNPEHDARWHEAVRRFLLMLRDPGRKGAYAAILLEVYVNGKSLEMLVDEEVRRRVANGDPDDDATFKHAQNKVHATHSRATWRFPRRVANVLDAASHRGVATSTPHALFSPRNARPLRWYDSSHSRPACTPMQPSQPCRRSRPAAANPASNTRATSRKRPTSSPS